MKLNILQIIYFCLINYVFNFPNELFDELWETNQSEPKANNNPIESQPKIKVEPHEKRFDGRWRDESALKGDVKVEHEPHYGAVKVERTIKIKHESADDLDQDNSKEKHLSDRNNSTDQDESVTKELGLSRETKFKLRFSELEKRQILKQFEKIKSKCKQAKLKNISINELNEKIAKKFGVSSRTIYKWKSALGLSVVKKKFSEFEKCEILKQFDNIKNKFKQTKIKNISMRELDEKIAQKLCVRARTIYKWKSELSLSVGKKFSDATKIGILKKYAKIKRKNTKMSDCGIADLLKISISSLKKWKVQFKDEIKNC